MTTPDPRAADRTEPEAAAGPRQIIGWLGPLLAAHKGRTAVALLLLLTSKGATVATPLVLKQVVDALTPLQGGRNARHRDLYDAQDEVDRKRAELIGGIERQLRTETEIAHVLALHWQLFAPRGTK